MKNSFYKITATTLLVISFLIVRTSLAQPVITSFTPESGCDGVVDTIYGSGFSNVLSVTFGGTDAKSFEVVSESEIIAIVGTGSMGSVGVVTEEGSFSTGFFDYLEPVIWWQDADNDGYGNAAVSFWACYKPTGWIGDSTDCDDQDANIHPESRELCNGLDDDCDGVADEVVTPNMMLYIPFDGSSVDKSGYEESGFEKAPHLTTDRFWRPDNAYDFFSGENSYLSYNDNQRYHLKNLSLVVWYNAGQDVLYTVKNLVSKALCPGVYDSYSIYFVDGKLATGWYTDNGNYYLSTDAPELWKWHFVAFTFDDLNNIAKFYVDGQLVGSTECFGSIKYDSSPITVGTEQENCNLAYWYNGKMDDIALFDGVLSDNDVQLLYNDGSIVYGMVEHCNGVDDDCDGIADDGLTKLFYVDVDGDSYGNPDATLVACSEGNSNPEGYVQNGLDCDDSKSFVYPGATEILNGIDDNCNGLIDEGLAQCAVPSGLDAVNITSNSAKLVWDEFPGAYGYKIKYKEVGPNNFVKYTTTNNYKKLNNLLPNTEYVWSIRTFCTIEPNITSDWSENLRFTTNAQRLMSDEETTFEVYPNPFTLSATVSFSLPENANVVINLFDMEGRLTQALVSENLSAGSHTFTLNRDALSAGIYFIKLQENDIVLVRKIVIEE